MSLPSLSSGRRGGAAQRRAVAARVEATADAAEAHLTGGSEGGDVEAAGAGLGVEVGGQAVDGAAEVVVGVEEAELRRMGETAGKDRERGGEEGRGERRGGEDD